MSDPLKPTEATVRSFSNDYNAATIQKQMLHEQVNSAYNHHVIAEAYKAGRARDLCDEPKAGGPAFVVGSGAALDDVLPQLKRWNGGVVCSTSQALALMYHGIEPTHIVVLDPFCAWDEIKGIDWSKTRTKLVAHPGVWPDLIANWPNDLLLYIQNSGDPNSFYNTVQKFMYTWREPDAATERNPLFHFMVRTQLTIFACSPPLQLFVADFLGYDTIFIVGMNWCKTGDKKRFTDYSIGPDGKWEAHPQPYVVTGQEITSNNGLITQPLHLYYKKNFISAWRLSHKTIYDVDRLTILTEVPHANIEKVIRRQGQGYPRQSHAMIDRLTERYLATVGAYVIITSQGTAFVESMDPEKEMPIWMENVNRRRWACSKCGAKAKAADDKDYTGAECLGCHEKTMRPDPVVDVEANMKRIRHLLALTKVRAELPPGGIANSTEKVIVTG